MQHDPCERIAIVEIHLEHIAERLSQIATEHSTMQKFVTEHTVHIQQQQDWVRDHTRLHRDWNMRVWLILIGTMIGAVASVIGALVG